MSLWTDIRDTIESPFVAVGDALGSAASSILHNPIGAITSAVAISYGIDPAWAGALGGAANAAASGGNVVKAAITGAAMGEMGSIAGAATGSYGPIAQAAATGAASAATGAVLTGQDVLAAMKSGLVLGAAIGGGYQLMTPKEAMSSVPQDVLAKANLSKDPIGTLNQEMGWVQSNSSTTAAQQALQDANSSGTLAKYYSNQIPDSVLQQASVSGNPFQTVLDKMGWSASGSQAAGVQDALNNYQTQSTPTTPTQTVEQEAQTAAQQQAQQAQQVQQITQHANTSAIDNITNSDIQQTLKSNGTDFYNQDVASALKTSNPLETLSKQLGGSDGPTAYSDSLAKNLLANKDIISAANQINNPVTSPVSPTTGTTTAGPVDPTQSATGSPLSYKSTTTSGDGTSTTEYFFRDGTTQTVSYNSQGHVTSSATTPPPASNPGAGVQVAALEPSQQQIINDSEQGYLSGKLSWDQASSNINKAVQTEIDNGYLKDAGNGEYVAPDGVVYNFNHSTGMWDTKTGVTGGTGSNSSAPVTPEPINPAPAPVAPVTPEPTTPSTPTTPVQPSTPAVPVEAPPTTPSTPTTPTYLSNPTNYNEALLSQNHFTYDQVNALGGVDKAAEQLKSVGANQTIQNANKILGTGAGTTTGVGTGTTTGTGTGTGVRSGPVTPVTTTPPTTDVGTITVTAPKTTEKPVVPIVPPLTPPTPVVIPPDTSKVTPVETTPTEPTTTTPTTPIVPIVPYVPPTTTPVSTGTFKVTPFDLPKLEIPTGLNPGWITNVPTMYNTTNPAEDKYYWGGHPYQPGSTFDPTLYNQSPNAPQAPFGANYAQTSATPQQILQSMQGRYPLLGTTSEQIGGPVQPHTPSVINMAPVSQVTMPNYAPVVPTTGTTTSTIPSTTSTTVPGGVMINGIFFPTGSPTTTTPAK